MRTLDSRITMAMEHGGVEKTFKPPLSCLLSAIRLHFKLAFNNPSWWRLTQEEDAGTIAKTRRTPSGNIGILKGFLH